jgi:exoribonuclease R
VCALGKVKSKEAEQESLLLEFEVSYRPFGKVILDCLPEQRKQWVVLVKSPTSLEWRDQADLRDLIICSIGLQVSACSILYLLLALMIILSVRLSRY